MSKNGIENGSPRFWLFSPTGSDPEGYLIEPVVVGEK